MKKIVMLAVFGALMASCGLNGFTYNIYKSMFDAIKRKPAGQLLVVNVSDSYIIKITGPRTDLTLQPQETKTIDIYATSGSSKGETITIGAVNKSTGAKVANTTYTRGENDDLLEIDAGRAPNFPELKGAGIGSRTWKSGRVSPYVRIWLRESFTQSIQKVYPTK